MREEVIFAARALAAHGLVTAFGHVSARTGGDAFVVTPPKPLGSLRPDEDLAWVSLAEPGLPAGVPGEVWIHLAGPDVTLHEVLAATDALAVAVEVVDSRIEDWRIKLADTIADNASYGGFTTGPWSGTLREADLRTLGMLLHKNGETVETGVGAAALGHPARAVAWLANKLASFDVSLESGDIVLSGALSKAVSAQRGDSFVLEMHGQPPLTATFV